MKPEWENVLAWLRRKVANDDPIHEDFGEIVTETLLAMAEQIEANRLAIKELQRKPVTQDGERMYHEIMAKWHSIRAKPPSLPEDESQQTPGG